MENNALRAGVARKIISPQPGVFLIGYGDRKKGNCGIQDDLTATALVLDDGSKRLAIVALDLLCLNEYIVDRVRTDLGTEIEVMLCCSHTHSAPIAYADLHSPRRNLAYINLLVERIQVAIVQATQNLAPARLAWSLGAANIAVNRRERQPDGHIEIGVNPAGVVDHSVSVVSVLSHSGERIATLVNYACHGTVLGPDNLLVSADWIGAMRQHVEKELGGTALFLQGATGDLNPAMGWGGDKGWEMLREQGERVGAAVVEACSAHMEDLPAFPISIERREVWLSLEAPANTPKPLPVYRKKLLSTAHLPFFMTFAVDGLLAKLYPWRSRIEARQGTWSIPLRVNVARLGELGLVTFGSETFTEIGMQVKSSAPARHTLFASVSDGCIGYLATAEAHAQGGYEVDLAPYFYRYPGRLAADSAERAITAVSEAWAHL
jgi:neutral ceramidase